MIPVFFVVMFPMMPVLVRETELYHLDKILNAVQHRSHHIKRLTRR